MYLQSIASWFPEQFLTQSEGWDLFRRSTAARNLRPRSVKLVEKILTGDSGIERRHFALPDIEQVFDLDAGQLNREFERGAPFMASRAAESALST